MRRRRTRYPYKRLTLAEKRKLRQVAARSWQDPVAAEHARDTLALDAAARRNPTDRRYATTKIIRRKPVNWDEVPTRIIRKNPKRRVKDRVADWWANRTKEEQRRLIALLSPAYARRNPPVSDRQLLLALKAMQRADRARGRRRKKHTRDYDRYMRRTKRNPARRNPKRDGSPTRGEKRRVKHLIYLKSIQAKGQDAAARIARLTDEVARTKPKDAYTPVGPRATKRVEKLDDVEYQERRLEPEQAAPVATSAPEPVEAKFLRSRLQDLDVLLKGAQDELKDLDQDSDLDAQAVSEVHDQIAKIAKQKKVLQDKLAALAVTQTNPRRRGSRAVVRIRRSTLFRMERAVRSLCKAVTTLSRAARR